jgi:glycosyltransferase involved in cell wall biosynthesis
MTSIHVCYGFPPDPIGGTEVYVAALARELARSGDRVVVAAPAKESASYSWEGLSVRRFRTRDAQSTADLYGQGDEVAAAEFERLLDEVRPDVVHVHALTHACSLRLIRVAKRRAPVVFTYHTPTVSCARGSLMEHGVDPCDGVLDARRCAVCVLEQHGVPAGLARVAARTPPSIARRVASGWLPARIGTAAQMPALMAGRQETFRSVMQTVDRVVALCEWTERLLLQNGVASSRIVRLSQALCQTPRPLPVRRRDDRLRLLFMGRLHRDKGIAVVLDAIERLEDRQVALAVYGTPQGEEGRAIQERLVRVAARDARITVHAPVPPAQVPDIIAAHDVMVVPSQGFETGPLVVLEAFAAGVPVLGSALGGIAELVHDGIDGRLVPVFNSPVAWRAAIAALRSDRGGLDRLRAGVVPPAVMAGTAVAVRKIYDSVLSDIRRPEALPA